MTTNPKNYEVIRAGHELTRRRALMISAVFPRLCRNLDRIASQIINLALGRPIQVRPWQDNRKTPVAKVILSILTEIIKRHQVDAKLRPVVGGGTWDQEGYLRMIRDEFMVGPCFIDDHDDGTTTYRMLHAKRGGRGHNPNSVSYALKRLVRMGLITIKYQLCLTPSGHHNTRMWIRLEVDRIHELLEQIQQSTLCKGEDFDLWKAKKKAQKIAKIAAKNNEQPAVNNHSFFSLVQVRPITPSSDSSILDNMKMETGDMAPVQKQETTPKGGSFSFLGDVNALTPSPTREATAQAVPACQEQSIPETPEDMPHPSPETTPQITSDHPEDIQFPGLVTLWVFDTLLSEKHGRHIPFRDDMDVVPIFVSPEVAEMAEKIREVFDCHYKPFEKWTYRQIQSITRHMRAHDPLRRMTIESVEFLPEILTLESSEISKQFGVTLQASPGKVAEKWDQIGRMLAHLWVLGEKERQRGHSPIQPRDFEKPYNWYNWVLGSQSYVGISVENALKEACERVDEALQDAERGFESSLAKHNGEWTIAGLLGLIVEKAKQGKKEVDLIQSLKEGISRSWQMCYAIYVRLAKKLNLDELLDVTDYEKQRWLESVRHNYADWYRFDLLLDLYPGIDIRRRG